jgi:hypothetical protein
MREPLIIAISLVAGTGDFASGCMLAACPARALRLMRVPPVQDTVFLRFTGCFVAVVGFLYLAGLLAWHGTRDPARLRAVWEITALFRLVAAAFVLIEIFQQTLPPGWLVVPIVDGFWCVTQVCLLLGGIFAFSKA